METKARPPARRPRYRLLITPQRHALLQRITKEFGDRLSGFYQTTAINVILNLIAVLLGFGLASAWQAREDQLRDLRSQMAVLQPLSEETVNLTNRAKSLQLAERCEITGFDTSVWSSLENSERAVLLEDSVHATVRKTYASLRRASATYPLMGQVGCQRQLDALRLSFGSLTRILDNEILRVEAEQRDLNLSRRLGLLAFVQSQTSGLLTFIGTTVGWLVAILLVAPAMVYGTLVAATKLLQPPP
jgi:hypothetical protein